MATGRFNLRQRALAKIAALAASEPDVQIQQREVHRLGRLCTHRNPRHEQSRSNGTFSPAPGHRNLRAIPIKVSELEVLLALCQTGLSLTSESSARQLLQQLTPYYEEAPFQQFAPSPHLRNVSPSPWEALSNHLVSAALSIGTAHPNLKSAVKDRVYTFLDGCSRGARRVASFQLANFDDDRPDSDKRLDQILGTASLTLSIVGFLRAASQYADFWSIGERLYVSQQIRGVLSDATLVNVEAAFSSIRTQDELDGDSEVRDWIQWGNQYEGFGRPLGAMLLRFGFMEFLCSSASLLLYEPARLRERPVLDLIIGHDKVPTIENHWEEDEEVNVVRTFARYVIDEMTILSEGADYLQLSSTGQQRLTFGIKGLAIVTYVASTFLNDSTADSETLMGWLESTVASPLEMADERLAAVVLKSLAALARLSTEHAKQLSSSLPRFIVQGGCKGRTTKVAADALSFALSFLSRDTLSSTMFTLGNVMTNGPGVALPRDGYGVNGTPEGSLRQRQTSGPLNVHMPWSASAISLVPSGEEEKAAVYGNVVQAMVRLAAQSKDEKAISLAFSLLIQKIGKVSQSVDARIIVETAILGVHVSMTDFKALLKLHTRLDQEAIGQKAPSSMLHAVKEARRTLATEIEPSSQLYEVYLSYLLTSITSKGDIPEGGNNKQIDIEATGKEISPLIPPLALLLSKQPPYNPSDAIEESDALFRDAWYNMSIHGFNRKDFVCKNHERDLRQIALRSPPLVSEHIADHLDTDLELNTVLRRGDSSQSLDIKRRQYAQVMPENESHIRRLDFAHVSFVNAVHLLETLRVEAGDCSQVAAYQVDRSLRGGDMGACMSGILAVVTSTYIRNVIEANSPSVSAARVAKQLSNIFHLCCHRVEQVQRTARREADLIIKALPTAVAQRESLFSLLELLSMAWNSCLAIDADGYDWSPYVKSAKLGLTVTVSDNYAIRRQTCAELYAHGKEWISLAMYYAPLDVKGLLQTYLSEDDVDETYGHVALGRSLALEMGTKVVESNHRLKSVPPLGGPVPPLDAASDFMAQFNVRQEYRYDGALLGDFSIKAIRDTKPDPADDYESDAEDVQELAPLLARVSARASQRRFIGVKELRDVLKRAAALLCRTSATDTSIVAHYFVQIPFFVFTKQAMKLGISLWVGVMNENPRVASRLLTEIALGWDRSINLRRGVYDPGLLVVDPFYVKQEFAPMDREAILDQQQQVSEQIGPHLHLLQFLLSHYNASHVSSPHVQRLFARIGQTSLRLSKYLSKHPLAREYRFCLILFGLDLLHHDHFLDSSTKWRLLDSILTTGLEWFAQAPCWSFGSNMLQLKSELRILGEVTQILRQLYVQRSADLARMLQAKHELLVFLLVDEQSRLAVWLNPIGNHPQLSTGRKETEQTLVRHLKLCWEIDPTLALGLQQRFPSDKLKAELRWFIVNRPQQAIASPDALQRLLGSSMPSDLRFQLKFLQHWAPVDPMSAVTLLQPSFQADPLILQYAMRALESHAVDTTFFYVPQIVQSLRHDPMGYVERFIVETGNFSQLFAHQIIWNMKANAYRGDEGTVEDRIKPTLDRVETHLLESFTGADKAFYEREFAFFNDVTGISGTLRQYLKEPKAVKKDKIAEELRKIKVLPGVYLPSNPDGIVVGIDRKSGKPLQSHAKTPFMATFLVQKLAAKSIDPHPVAVENQAHDQIEKRHRDPALEIRQSAIFKVGDDCRQDVLVLQMIAAFRSIYNACGLDVFVYPNQVIATAPGCGVIEVLPNSISRDMMGRESVNGLSDYWRSKYGSAESSTAYLLARTNFVKSMAAYSVISWLLQFKDRHNGNIMFDDAGHILHIDFGFCFDIAPGGVKFERAPFKLTAEMIAVLGGEGSFTYRWFEELCIKAFLVSRVYVDKLENLVRGMLESGLPCFKPNTLENFRARFALERDEGGAAKFMAELVRKSGGARSTIEYDRFQRITNDIPY